MLADNKTLQKIGLNDNNISDKGAQSIATSLVVNTGIQEIRLQGNTISDTGAKKLAEALESNHSIKDLDLWNDNVSWDVMDRIGAILEHPNRKILANEEENNTAKKDIEIEKDQSKPPKKRTRTEDTPMTKDEEIALLRAKLKALEGESELAKAGPRTEDTSKPKTKILSVQLDYEHTHCSICPSKFSTDLDNKDENIRKSLPVLSSSKTCDHYFCHGCILKQQLELAEKSGRFRKWI